MPVAPAGRGGNETCGMFPATTANGSEAGLGDVSTPPGYANEYCTK